MAGLPFKFYIKNVYSWYDSDFYIAALVVIISKQKQRQVEMDNEIWISDSMTTMKRCME